VDEHREIHDAIIVGAGPGGLTAAVYFGRFRRHCMVLEDDHPRARWIPTSHNIPGFTTGIGGEEFLATLKEQALQYGAQLRRAHVSALTDNGDIFTLQTEAGMFSSRYVLLATGVRDHLPDIEGASEAVKRGLLRVCPVCDAFEAIDKRIAVIGDGALAEREADFLSNYSDQVTLLQIASSTHAAAPGAVNAQDLERITISVSELKVREDRVTLSSAHGERDFDVGYLALGCSPQHDLARSLQAACDDHGALMVNAHQETSVRRLYAAGDVVRGLNQVIVAASESTIAATDIHNKLRGNR
jgi:thioredoxin reductase (NADPH)